MKLQGYEIEILTTERTYQVRAESAEALAKWLVVINGAAKLAVGAGDALVP
eukprot:COSAG05_NODE_17216_length_329_cov_1.178261_1_plen_50_part_10